MLFQNAKFMLFQNAKFMFHFLIRPFGNLLTASNCIVCYLPFPSPYDWHAHVVQYKMRKAITKFRCTCIFLLFTDSVLNQYNHTRVKCSY